MTTPNPLALADECEASAENWLNEIDTRLNAAALLRTQHTAIERKDALLRQALDSLKNSRSLEPVDVAWVKGGRLSVMRDIEQELSQ